MASAYSGNVTEWHGGYTKAWVEAYVVSETDKQATIYVRGCANGNRLTQYGVATSCGGAGATVGTGSGVISAASGSGDFAWCSGYVTVNKSAGGHYVSCFCSIWGATVGGFGGISGSATAYVDIWVNPIVLRPPSAPTNLKGARNAAASIDLSWTNNASNATTTLIERMQKNGTWTVIYNQGNVITAYTDSPGIGSFKYRVRYYNADGYSGYSNETDYIVTLSPPAAPTTVSPPSGSTVNANDGTVVLTWRHNSIDSSAQTAAEIKYSYDENTWENITVETEQQTSITLPENGSVWWQVRTKGAHEDFGPWSAVTSFLVRTAPVAVLSVPSPVTNVPIPVSWAYDDAMGTQIAAELSILDESGATLFKKALGNESAYVVPASDFTPVNDKTYTVVLRVTSSTSLTYSTRASFDVKYEPPTRPKFSTEVDLASASVKITVLAGDGDIQTRAMSVFRNGLVIAENLMSGQSCTDETPPLDTEVEYRVIAYAPSGAVADSIETVIVPSKGFVFFNFNGTYAKMAMDLASTDTTEGNRIIREVASDDLPKVFYGKGRRRRGTETANVWWSDDVTNDGKDAMLERVKKLKEYNGKVHMRRPFDDSFNIDCTVTYGVAAGGGGGLSSITVQWEAQK